MRHAPLVFLGIAFASALLGRAAADTAKAVIRTPVDESVRVTLAGNTPPVAATRHGLLEHP